MNIADVQDRLYGEPADQFVRRRADEVREAKRRGDRELADAIAEFRKPTAAAQALNQFARAHGDEIEALLGVGARLRDAVDRGDGDEIRAVMRERVRTVANVVQLIRRYSDERGEPLSASVASQVEQTLRAAMSSEEHATLLRRGVLASVLSDAGVEAMRASRGPGRATNPADEPADGEPVVDQPVVDEPDVDQPDDEDEPAAARSRRQAARDRATAAADSVARIRAELDDAVARRSELEVERQTVKARLDELERQLAAARVAESEIESRMHDARSHLRAARSGRAH